MKKRKFGFTLAEVLVTLGIIGVVAALTLPGLIQNYQKIVLKNQFKKSYSQFFNALKLAQAKSGAPVTCYYWVKRPYGSLECVAWDEHGNCTKSALPDGSPIPSDFNGLNTDCRKFYDNELFGNVLKVAKHCAKNSLANGCITENYKGIDKVKTEVDPSVTTDPNSIFSDTLMKNTSESWLLTDGSLIMKHGSSTWPLFMIDINGHKRPNKWGYDLFTVIVRGTENDGITKLEPYNYYYEEGGFSSSNMLFNSFNK